MRIELMGQEFGQGEGSSLLQTVQSLSREDIMAGGDFTAGSGNHRGHHSRDWWLTLAVGRDLAVAADQSLVFLTEWWLQVSRTLRWQIRLQKQGFQFTR